VINRRIDESMVAFDHRMQHEQDELNKERDAATATGAAGAAGAGGGAEGGGQEGGGGAGSEKGGAASGGAQGGSGTPGSAAGAPRTGGSAGGSSGGSAAGGGSGPARLPADVGNGSDDDIVARQLREAAMKEKDPQLQEKLWQEYRDYKQAAK